MRHILRKLVGSTALALTSVLVPFVAAQAVTISPPFFEYSLNPGDVVLDVLKIFNEDDAPITLYPVVMNFTHTEGDEGGTPSFYAADEDPNGTALAQWITITNKGPIKLEPKQRANLQFSINVPADKAQPGGHFGTILLSTQPPPSEGGTVAIGQQIGALVFVRVSGEVKEVGNIAEFGFQKPRVWYNYLPVDFFLRFENAGNTHLRPTGNLFIKNWMGRQVAAVKVNEQFAGVLPLSIRRFEFGWRHRNNPEGASELWKEWHNFAFGKYTATLVVNYGADNQLVTDTRVFYVWPWRLLVILSGGALVVLVLVMYLMKAYNRAVIKKYEIEKERKK